MICWYAVYTRPHAETKALEHLLRQGYQAYLPRYRTRVSHARRRQTVLRPLFPRYLFAGLDRAHDALAPDPVDRRRCRCRARRGRAGAGAVRHRRRDSRSGRTAGSFDRTSTAQSLRLGELVRVTAGAFEDMVGRLVELRDQDRVVVLLDLLGRAVRAQLRAEAVEAA